MAIAAEATRIDMAETFASYLDHFGLSQRPFALTPDPDFMFWSDAHRGAYAMLQYGLASRAPITLLTGEIGAGKTLLLRYFVEGLGDDVTLSLVTNTRPGMRDILQWLLPELANQSTGDEQTFQKVREFFIREFSAGRRVALIIDEAQNLSMAALEELRMLTNINIGKEDVLQLFLVGQPELRDMVRRPQLLQFAQRVAANYHIPVMDSPTVARYIAHRLRVAGGRAGIFSRQAAEEVHDATGGVPRLINQLCDLSLTYAYAENDTMVRRTTVRAVLEDGVFFGLGQAPGQGG